MPEQPQSFEQALQRLEQVVRELESGERSLDEALALFQEGIGLTRYCQQRLDEAEARVEQLLELKNGVAVTEPFTPGGNG